MQYAGHHAIVIGASMGGLLAARALADSFEQVTIVERDRFPVPREPRKGVPQGRHTHGLLPSGRKVIEEMFPGLTQEMVEHGAVLHDASAELRRSAGGGYHARFRNGAISLAFSRPLLDDQIRARLLALPNVRMLEGCAVLGLVASDDRRRVTEVRLRRGAEDAEEVLSANLVVDATGRGSRAPVWLESLGYPAPVEERVHIDVTYTTRLYRRTPEHLQGDTGVFVPAIPGTKRAGFLLAQEGDRWIVTLGGYLDEIAPSDDEGFIAYARSLPTPDIATVLADAEPLSDFARHKFPANVRRRYERLDRFPEGFLVFGDALCAFNPTYGQGMTVAAFEARALQECLAAGAERLAQRFFGRAREVVDIAWALTVGADLRVPGVEGRRGVKTRIVNWYLDKLHIAARYDPEVSLAFGKVASLTAPPTSLLQPRIAARVFRGNFRPAPRTSSVGPTRASSPTHG
jgi:2-polyprenyl-6-methoxyphenol hydroxylase-like FAD-dependent oxidoreductase